MDTEVKPATTDEVTPAEETVPTPIQVYKQKLDVISKEMNLFLQSTLVCTKCGSTDIGTEIRIMEGGAVSEAPAETSTTPPADPSPAEVTTEVQAAPEPVVEGEVLP